MKATKYERVEHHQVVDYDLSVPSSGYITAPDPCVIAEHIINNDTGRDAILRPSLSLRSVAGQSKLHYIPLPGSAGAGA